MLNKFNYSKSYIYKAGLPRYDLYNKPKKYNSSKKCILIFFTYRFYNNNTFQRSLYKKNLKKLLNNHLLIENLKKENIDLIYIQHHRDSNSYKQLKKNFSKYATVTNHINLTDYIQQCSLLITDYSSVAFAFMFQNKPTLFYLIDYNDKLKFFEKQFFKLNDPLYFGNYFINQNKLIKKIQYYIKNNFVIDKTLKKKYESVFYYKVNIN